MKSILFFLKFHFIFYSFWVFFFFFFQDSILTLVIKKHVQVIEIMELVQQIFKWLTKITLN